MIQFDEKISERELSSNLGLSRTTLRKAVNLDESIKLSTLKIIAKHYDRDIEVLIYPKQHIPDCSSVAISFRILIDGFDSWKIHLMDMVDEFRRTLDPRLFILPPEHSCPSKLKALIAATVLELCYEAQINFPECPKLTKALDRPWFLSGMESLKASALIETPYTFRSKNIFVHENFLKRA